MCEKYLTLSSLTAKSCFRRKTWKRKWWQRNCHWHAGRSGHCQVK